MLVSTEKPRHVGREAGLVKRFVEVRLAPHSWARSVATAASAPRIRGQQSQLKRDGFLDHWRDNTMVAPNSERQPWAG
jgi:hypothetical protein